MNSRYRLTLAKDVKYFPETSYSELHVNNPDDLTLSQQHQTLKSN